jgi:tetratricopeptide (TPR) repeat protein
MTNIAILYDDQLSEAYTIRGEYYREIGNPESAMKEYDKAIKLNPNDWEAYSAKGILYGNYDLVKSIYNFNKPISINRDEDQLPTLFRDIGWAYQDAGFPEKCKDNYQKAFNLDRDSSSYYRDSLW